MSLYPYDHDDDQNHNVTIIMTVKPVTMNITEKYDHYMYKTLTVNITYNMTIHTHVHMYKTLTMNMTYICTKP